MNFKRKPHTKDLISYSVKNDGSFIVNLKAPHIKFVDRVLRSSSIEELYPIFMTAESPAKEISESYAALSTLKKFVQVSDSICYHVADGGWARTAAIFTFFTKSINYSIDPALDQKDRITEWMDVFKVKNLTLFKDKVEKFIQKEKSDTKRLITAVHSHVDLETIDKHLDWDYLYANECCIELKFSENYMKKNNIALIYEQNNWGILSEKRLVRVYKKMNAA